MKFELRTAAEEEIPMILQFIHEIAEYEKMSDQVVATEALLREWLFEKKLAQVLIASCEGKDAGFALFFYNFSTFVGRAGLYLEDIYVRPEYRGQGLGRLFFRTLAGIALERGCGRMEWSCLDWNEKSAGFYRSLGAQAMDEWTVYRLSQDALAKLRDDIV